MMTTQSAPIRILILDDHALFRDGLVRLLEAEPDFAVVGCCGTVHEAIALLSQKSPDIVLLDYDLGNEKGSEFLSEASQIGFQGRTLVLTAGVASLEARKLVRLGASGVFLKYDPPNLLAKSIRDVVAGRSWFRQELFRELVSVGAEHSEKHFTEREKQVLRNVVEGLSNKEIGARLAISESAVKAVLQQLFHKTGFRTRAQLVRVALEEYRGEY